MKPSKETYAAMHKFCADMKYRVGLAGIVQLGSLIEASGDKRLIEEYISKTEEWSHLPDRKQRQEVQAWLDHLFGSAKNSHSIEIKSFPQDGPVSVSVNLAAMEHLAEGKPFENFKGTSKSAVNL